MLIIPLIPATALIVFWLLLLKSSTKEDWATGAYNQVLDNRMAIEKLQKKDRENAEKLAEYHGIAHKVMSLLIDCDSSKKIRRLQEDNEDLQNGYLKSLSLFSIPGYVLQRKYESIGKSSVHRTIFNIYTELYGKKYAPNKTKHLLAQMLSYPIIGVGMALLLGTLMMGSGNKTAGFAVMGFGTIIVLVLVYALYDDAKDKLKKRRGAISRQFPNVVSKLALLVSSGMIMDKAWRQTAESQDTELYREMQITSEEMANLVDPATAYTNFLNRCSTKETTKLASALIQSQTKGNAEIGLLLKGMAHDAWQERRHTAKRDSEAANSKLMIPTMLLFIAILVMIMVPVAINFMNL